MPIVIIIEITEMSVLLGLILMDTLLFSKGFGMDSKL